MAERSLVAEVAAQLSAIFRHMLPGVLVVGSTRLAYPDRFTGVIGLDSWQHIFVWAVVTLAVGNAWFALNRYGLHQVFDWFFYLLKLEGPARGDKWWHYLDDLASYTYYSQHTSEDAKRAQEHIQFRASAVLLILTIGELAFLFSIFPGEFAPWRRWLFIGSILVMVVGGWQKIITRRIDSIVVRDTPRSPNSAR